jgi:hypothetical protein
MMTAGSRKLLVCSHGVNLWGEHINTTKKRKNISSDATFQSPVAVVNHLIRRGRLGGAISFHAPRMVWCATLRCVTLVSSTCFDSIRLPSGRLYYICTYCTVFIFLLLMKCCSKVKLSLCLIEDIWRSSTILDFGIRWR